MHRAVLLHNIRSAHNVGSIFRTADGAGIEHIYLSGYTPLPTDRFKRPQKDIAKTALGAELSIPWTHIQSASLCIDKLKKEGWLIVAVEQDARAVDYRTVNINRSTLFIFGNEVRGMSAQLKRACDTLIHIPMHGSKESLNVSVAAGVILFGTRGTQ